MVGLVKCWIMLLDIPWKEILSAVLTFLYTLAHYVGYGVLYLLGRVLPPAKLPTELVDPIGYLVLLTIFLAIVQVAKKLAWIIVIVAWALIAVRILLGLFGY